MTIYEFLMVRNRTEAASGGGVLPSRSAPVDL
jgi:hypothetical protein